VGRKRKRKKGFVGFRRSGRTAKVRGKKEQLKTKKIELFVGKEKRYGRKSQGSGQNKGGSGVRGEMGSEAGHNSEPKQGAAENI